MHHAIVVVSSSLLLVGCQDVAPADVDAAVDRDGGSIEGDAAGEDAAGEDAGRADAGGTDARVCTDTAVVFLATEGINLQAGFESAINNTSTLIPQSVSISAYLGAELDREETIAAIIAQVEGVLAPYDVLVTRDRPSSGPYRMIVMGHSPTQAGFDATTFAVIPFTCQPIANAIGFVFETGSSSSQEIALASTLIISELAMLAGLPSTNLAGDCLCYNGPVCDFAELCTFGGAGTPTQENGCEEPATIDPQAAFATTFPCD